MKARGIMKLAYLNVVIRTGIAAAAIGAITAWVYNNATPNYINLIAVWGVIIVLQGLAQHSLDTLLDEDNTKYSGFRGSVKEMFTPKQLRQIFGMAILFAAIVTIIGTLLIGHWFFIIVFALGALCIVLYAVTHIESYAWTSFSLCAIAGFLSQNDINFLIGPTFFIIYGPLFSVFVLLLSFYGIGQILYRVDDYINEMTEPQLVAYYRHNLRKRHHPMQLGIISLLLWMLHTTNTPIPSPTIIPAQYGWAYLAWIASGSMLLIWYTTRHTTCNNIHCHKNRIRLMETGKKPCQKTIKSCLGKDCKNKCKIRGKITWQTIGDQQKRKPKPETKERDVEESR